MAPFTANASSFSDDNGSGNIGCSLVDGTNNTTSVGIGSNTQINPYPSAGISYSYQCFWGSLATTNYLYISGGFTPGGDTIYITASQLNSMSVPPPNDSIPGRYFIGQTLVMLYYSYLTYTNDYVTNEALPVEFLIPNPPFGSLNSYGGIQISIPFIVQPCGVPTSISAPSYQSGQVPLSWTAPSDDGGSSITSYIIQYNSTGSAPWNTINTNSSYTSYSITGLTNGTTYYFQVAAINGYCNNGTGYGPISGLYSTTSTAIPSTTPDTPTGLTATGGVGSIYATWTAPSYTGGAAISSYTLGYGLSGAGITNTIGGISPSSLNYTITGLLNGTSYDIQVAASNASGQGAYSPLVTTTTFNIPSSPTGLTGTSGNTQVSLTWTAPYNGGTPITNYLVEYKLDSDSSWTQVYTGSTSASYVVGPPSNSLNNGSIYDFRVSAINIIGTSSPSSIIYATPSTTPNYPTITSSQSNQNQQSSVAWTPNYDGGAPILYYSLQYTTSLIAPITWLPTSAYNIGASSTSFIFPSLTNGTTYYFQVAAINLNGIGSYSLQTPFSNATPSTTPDAPTIITATAGVTSGVSSIFTTWTAPLNTGGAAISSYTIGYGLSGAGITNTIGGILPTSFNYNITGLLNGTSYDIQVAASNASGQGAYSPIVTTTTFNIPNSPTGLTGTSGNTQVSLTWTAPVNDGGTPITGYLVEYKLDSGSSWTQSPTGSIAVSYLVTGLNNGFIYDFRVSAINVLGTSSPSSIIYVTPSTIPSAPVITSSLSYQNQQSLVTWTPPYDGGAPILYYSLQYTTSLTTTPSIIWLPPSAYTIGGSLTSFIFPSLTNGTLYYFQVAAINLNGIGNYSSQTIFSNATPSTTPNAPTGLSTASGVSSISVVWNIPYNGGAEISSYTLQYRVSGSGSWTTITGIPITLSPNNPHYVITGLLASTTYDIHVAAVNASGQGSYSIIVQGQTDTTPDNPTNLQGVHGNAQVSLTWTAPVNDGGTPIIQYLVEYKLDYVSSWTQVYTGSNAPAYVVGPPSNSLTNGIIYDFRVSGVNAVGVGSHSSIIEVIPSTTPAAPVIISSESCDNQQVLVTWSPPSDDGGAPITSYNLQYSTTGLSGSWLPTPTPYSVPAPPVSTITTSTIYNWNTLANGQSKTFVVNNASSYQVGNSIGITYSNSDSITGTITAIAGNNITITITSFANATYVSTTIYTSTPVDTSTYAGSVVDPFLILDPAVSTPTPPIIPANSVITNGQCQIYTASTPVNFNMRIYELNTSTQVGSDSSSNTTTTPHTPSNFTFADGVFITPAQGIIMRANTFGQSVDYGFPLGGSYSPADFCGFLSGYTLGYSQGTINILPITLSYTFTGLTNGTLYYFQVAAVNFNGAGAYSASSTATPSITPQPPIPITTTAITSTSIALSWTAPTNTGGNLVTGYLIYWSEISSTGSIIPPTYSYNTTTGGTPLATTYTITGLTHATLYAIQISSINCSGFGPLSAPPLYVTTSSIPPSAPTNVAIVGCNTGYTNSVILTWTAPADDGGSPITNYVIYYRTSSVGSSPPGTWYTYNTNSDATTAIVMLPSSSTSYDFEVAAQNAAGVGIFSSPIVSSSSYNPPTAPTNLVANTNSNGFVNLSWTPSTQEAPQYISYYVIEYKLCEFGGWITYPTTIPASSNSATISDSNIANNTPYLYRVYAVNSCGARSDPSNEASATSFNNNAPTHLWSRFNLNCSGNITSVDNLNQTMLRKGQVLQYPVVGTLQFSRATLWSMAAKNQLSRQKAWASQSQEYTYPNITNINNQPGVGLRQTPTSLVCWTAPPAVICNSSTASDVPGNPTTLCISKNAPFNNYRRPITYSSGGTKFPVFFSK